MTPAGQQIISIQIQLSHLKWKSSLNDLLVIIIPESDPQCYIEVQENLDSVYANCAVNYSGAWAPIIQWYQQSNETGWRKVDDYFSKNVTTSSSVSYSVNITDIRRSGVTQLSSQTVFVEETHGDISYSDTPPNYSYQWDSPKFHLMPATGVLDLIYFN